MRKAIYILLLSATVIGFSGCQSAARNLEETSLLN